MATARAGRTAGWQVALLRGINVGGHRKVPMAQLRAACEAIGWRDVATYVQSGNVVFRAAGAPAALERALEAAIEERFGFAVPVIVRTAADWLAFAADVPFPDAQRERPNLLLLALRKGGVPAARQRDALAALAPYCRAGERIAIRGDAIWIDFAVSVARSKLTPAVLDRVFGAPVTARNVKTVQAIAALLESSPPRA